MYRGETSTFRMDEKKSEDGRENERMRDVESTGMREYKISGARSHENARIRD